MPSFRPDAASCRTRREIGAGVNQWAHMSPECVSAAVELPFDKPAPTITPPDMAGLAACWQR